MHIQSQTDTVSANCLSLDCLYLPAFTIDPACSVCQKILEWKKREVIKMKISLVFFLQCKVVALKTYFSKESVD